MKIEAKNLLLKYNGTPVLKDLSFQLEGKKIFGLLGRNGAGKTSLLSLIASFREPTSGTLLIDGEVPFENTKIMEQVAFIYERNYKEDTTTVKDMLEGVERYRPNYDREYAMYLVNLFNLPLKQPVNKLSLGMQSALNVVMGLSGRTPLTIFDEAYLGMDAPTREIFYRELLEEQARHLRTFILSTHLVSEMDYLFDEVLILHQGKILYHESYEELVSRGATITGEAEKVNRFIGTRHVLHEQRLGNVKAVVIHEILTEEQIQEAKAMGLDVGPISLQELFIHLTGEGK